MLSENELPVYMTLKEFRAKVFPIAERTVWRLISTGDFPKPAARIGKKTAVWRTEDLMKWIETQEQQEQNHRPINVVDRRRKKKTIAK